MISRLELLIIASNEREYNSLVEKVEKRMIETAKNDRNLTYLIITNDTNMKCNDLFLYVYEYSFMDRLEVDLKEKGYVVEVKQTNKCSSSYIEKHFTIEW